MGHSMPSTATSSYPSTTTHLHGYPVCLCSPCPFLLWPIWHIQHSIHPKPQTQKPLDKTWVICCPTTAPISPPIHSDWSSDEDWDSARQKERERISEAVRIEDRKIAEEESRRKVKEKTHSCAPGLLGDKQNLPPTNHPASALVERKSPKRSKRIK